ncbi:helix-turn-helix domain-containing protein [Saccharopolyspora sp. HNM0986]|uniref:helix-turn-helix domain-containing protein n=1 Tax=Saccharopolyspora galaxeae TaxID=2781241 RepID=UPI001909FC9E|nr:helix-turn-helix domain-containing protein [Saccharopolyspora sp. HNM0986]MBK0870235.1 helix-turn-helix domain-containing protein [Saccharopolyspora sp. HNM0986]
MTPRRKETRPADSHRDKSTPTESENGSATATSAQLYTPKQAAEMLTVKESWLRRKAGTRSIPCTFLGKHLRFSERDLHAIIAHGARTPAARRGRPRR